MDPKDLVVEGMTFSIGDPTPHSFVIMGSDNKPLLTIDLVNKEVTADTLEDATEAGKVFVEYIREMVKEF